MANTGVLKQWVWLHADRFWLAVRKLPVTISLTSDELKQNIKMAHFCKMTQKKVRRLSLVAFKTNN